MNRSALSRIALLAGAAAALPIAAHADIVYSGPESISADAFADGSNSPQTYTLNMDGNAASAFTFTAEVASEAPSTDAITAQQPTEIYAKVYVTPGGANGYLSADGLSGSDPTPLSYGQVIGSGSSFSTGDGTLSKTGIDFDDYNWPADGTPAYLGVSFTDPALGADTYYGWIQVSATTDDATFDITGSAYCNTGGSIMAGQTSGACDVASTPEPSSLALLALGATGLVALRARRRSRRA